MSQTKLAFVQNQDSQIASNLKPPQEGGHKPLRVGAALAKAFLSLVATCVVPNG